MKDANLTKAYLQNKDDFANIKINISSLNIKNFKEKQYLLIIQSTIENCIRLSIYPLEKKSVIKITLAGLNQLENAMDELSKILQNFNIIHTSGLILKREEVFYECYLNLNISDERIEALKNNIQKIFKKIKIEEISLNSK